MERPPESACPNALRYWVARKNEYAILCIAACDANRKFLFYDMSMISTTHDSLAFSSSSMGRRINTEGLPEPFFLNGDNAFVATETMMTPSNDPSLAAYDFEQSSLRMPIECAFGILARRWGVLWRPLRVRFDRRTALVGALIRLHNFCIDKRIEEEVVVRNGTAEIQPGCWGTVPPILDRDGNPVKELSAAERLREHPDDAALTKRQKLVNAISREGLQRPAVSKGLHAKKKKMSK